MLIRNVSDTARWVATYRAMETDRPDAIFRDPFARRLAGDRGAEIVRTLPRAKSMAWAMVTRTKVFDEFIERAVSRDSVDLILNLAAGLDARPWRMRLPPTVRWIDVDLPDILAYKQEIMVKERPLVAYDVMAADLSDAAARRALFDRIDAQGRRVLVVTEGLLVYLPAADVTALATDIRNRASFQWWAFDLASRGVLRFMQKSVQNHLGGGTTMQFAPAEGTQFFERMGWWVSEFRLSLSEARRLRREMPMAWLWRPLVALDVRRPQEKSLWRTGYVLLQNPATAERATLKVSPT